MIYALRHLLVTIGDFLNTVIIDYSIDQAKRGGG